MRKKTLSAVFAALAATCVCVGFSACGKTDAGNGAQDDKIREIYASYVAHAEEIGDTPLSYEEWLATIKGEKGEKGDPGAQGEKGADGKDGRDGVDGKDGTCSCEKDKPQTEEEKVKADYVYTIENGQVTIDGYLGKDENLKIPAEIDGYPVVAIASMAFFGAKTLGAVTFPASLKSIGYMAFSGNAHLQKLYFERNASIACVNDAFLFCPVKEIHIEDLETWSKSGKIPRWGEDVPSFDLFIGNEKVENLVIPNGVTEIGAVAFYGCRKLQSVSVADSVTSIGRMAFANCVNVKKIVLGGGVKNIADNAFYGYTPEKVYYEGEAAEWENITIANNNKNFIEAPRYYYSETKPEVEGNYWHYNDKHEIEEW